MDLARLSFEYSKVSLDALTSADSKDSTESADSSERLLRARAKWIDDLVNSLVLRDPSRSSYGAHLLAEVEEYRKAESERKKGFRVSAESAESALSTESADSPLRTDRADRSGKKKTKPVGGGRSSGEGGSRDRGAR